MPVEALAVANANLPIARLISIPELFAFIVHCALDVYPPLVQQRLGAAVVVSHVSYACRLLCLSTPTLWARQIGKLPTATREFLARSSKAELDIHWASWNPSLASLGPSSIPSIQPSCVRSLRWGGSSGEPPETHGNAAILHGILSGALPNLRSLDFYGIYWRRDFAPRQLDILDVPQLALLRLYSVSLGQTLLRFNAPALKSLSIRQTPLSLSSVVNILQLAPLLETLDLDLGVIEIDIGRHQISPLTITLPHLHDVYIYTAPRFKAAELCEQLLNMLVMQTRSLKIQTETQWTDSLLTIGLRHALARGIPACLYIKPPLQFYALEDDIPFEKAPDFDCQDVLASLSSKSQQTIEHLHWVWSALPRVATPTDGAFSYIVTLVLHTCYAAAVSDVDTRSLFCALPQIETFWVIDQNVRMGYRRESTLVYDCFIDALMPGSTTSALEQTPFTRLRYLGLGLSTNEPAQLLTSIHRVLV
ncbi:unnamed protein product [Peniophora sp. CBMAI 1063]|nr:unnamed protein product [Peniophora sp. CBMAI 1063]